MVVTGSVVAADEPSKDTGKNELEKLQGSWLFVSAEANGEKVPDAAVKGIKMVVKGNKMTFSPPATIRESVFQLDAAKSPKQIILTSLDGPSKGVARRGFYSLEKGVLTWLLEIESDATTDPAAELSTRPDDGLVIFVLKREKPTTDNAK